MGKVSTRESGPQLGIWTNNKRPPCFECGDLAHHDHHVVPRMRGGTKTVPLCAVCHRKIHGTGVKTSHLVKEAVKRKREQGEHIGAIPLGYRLARDGRHVASLAKSSRHLAYCLGCLKIEPDPEIGILYWRVTELTRRGLSCVRIAKVLNEEGYKGKRWGSENVWRVQKLLGINRPPQPAKPKIKKPPKPLVFLEPLPEPDALREVARYRELKWGYKAIASALNHYGYIRAMGSEYTRDAVRDIVREQKRANRVPKVMGRMGPLPFGFELLDGKLLKKPDECAIVVRMAEMRAAGMTLQAIADTLNAEGVSPKKASLWVPCTVRALILKVDSYRPTRDPGGDALSV